MNPIQVENLDPRNFIIIKNARQNNLKNLDAALPQNKLIVITGISGSGKSSLAFDTLYAEGQRRYVESLSAYIRQFMGKINKPAVDYIKGLSPAVAIQQKVNTNNPRSTVGTATEIYDYLKLLYARIGRTISPISGKEVKRDTVDSVVAHIETMEPGAKVQVLSPLFKNENRTWKEELNIILQKGFNRLEVNGGIVKVEDILSFMETGETELEELRVSVKKTDKLLAESFLLVDRLTINPGDEENRSRMSDSVQTAFYEGHGVCTMEIHFADRTRKREKYSDKFELDGIVFEEPSVNLFTFNNPYGACKSCEGFGLTIGIDENRVVPDKSLSVYEEAVACWKGEKMSEWLTDFIKNSR